MLARHAQQVSLESELVHVGGSVLTAAAQTPLLTTRGLGRSFGRLVALRDLSVSVSRGEIFGVIGPTGSGKSTFFNVVTGFLKADSGGVSFDGAEIAGRPATEIVRLGIARTFQGTRLFRAMTVRDNLLAAAALRTPTAWWDGLLGTPRLKDAEAAANARTDELLHLINLTNRADSAAGDLPYGDQRRLELARALATRPKLLMLDEPAAGMDTGETKALLGLIDDVRKREGLTVIVVEHDMDLIMTLCDRVHVLAQGQTVFEGTPKDVQANARVREVYLGAEDEAA